MTYKYSPLPAPLPHPLKLVTGSPPSLLFFSTVVWLFWLLCLALFFFKACLFTQFWLRWAFLAPRLPWSWRAGAAPRCGAQRLPAAASPSRSPARGTRAAAVAALGSVVVAHVLSCSSVCGIFLDPGSNPRPLHGQADAYPLNHQGSPPYWFLNQLECTDKSSAGMFIGISLNLYDG